MDNLKDNLTVEGYLSEIQKIVNTLEAGNKTLEDSIALYSEGAKIINSCKKILDEARVKVKIINEENGLQNEEEI